jgi:hypothetical protein
MSLQFTITLSGKGLRRGSAAVRLLGLRVPIPPVACLFVCWKFCVLWDRVLYVWLIIRPEESYRVWVWSWSRDREEALRHWGLLGHGKILVIKRVVSIDCYFWIWFKCHHIRRHNLVPSRLGYLKYTNL